MGKTQRAFFVWQISPCPDPLSTRKCQVAPARLEHQNKDPQSQRSQRSQWSETLALRFNLINFLFTFYCKVSNTTNRLFRNTRGLTIRTIDIEDYICFSAKVFNLQFATSRENIDQRAVKSFIWNISIWMKSKHGIPITPATPRRSNRIMNQLSATVLSKLKASSERPSKQRQQSSSQDKAASHGSVQPKRFESSQALQRALQLLCRQLTKK